MTSVIVVTLMCGIRRPPTVTKPLATVCRPGTMGCHGFTSEPPAAKCFGSNVRGILIGVGDAAVLGSPAALAAADFVGDALSGGVVLAGVGAPASVVPVHPIAMAVRATAVASHARARCARMRPC